MVPAPDNRSVSQQIDWGRVTVLTFDCYGTLIDWERGILASLRSLIGDGGSSDDELLEAYGRAESVLESGPWLPYRRVLSEALAVVCRGFDREPTPSQIADFGESVRDWPPFPDSAAALARLAERFEMGVVTNCDEDLFAASAQKLGQQFSWAVTAEQVRSYKPARRHFEVALERIDRPPDQLVHVAQSLYHDHVPAKSLGLRTAWIDRRHALYGFGATPAAEAQPDLVVPDMAAFADIALAD